jgi:Tubulin/FtsZ family, GTPase domain
MGINLEVPEIRELKPRITVFGVGGAGGNAVNNMIDAGLQGVDFVVANTDAQALTMSRAERIIQMGVTVTEGLGAGSQPDVGRAATRSQSVRLNRTTSRTSACRLDGWPAARTRREFWGNLVTSARLSLCSWPPWNPSPCPQSKGRS